MPGEERWGINRCSSDVTSTSLRKADPTSGSLRKADLTSRSLREILRRGTLVVPGEERWGINRCSSDVTSTSLRKADPTSGSLRKADLTSRSLREILRRGTLVVPGEERWGINRCSSDVTSTSLRKADPTSRSLREADLTSRSLREILRRGTLVVPGAKEWGVNRCSSDVTSTSLRYADLTGTSLRSCRGHS